MNDFRLASPKRRPNPRTVSRYTQYKSDLCEDFEHCCGYCGDNDSFSGGKRFYQIDHFIPKTFYEVDELDYTNLVYSCFFCNNRKRGDWPTGKVELHNDGTNGYIDPCHEDFPKQFKRNSRGEIIPSSPLGNYMHFHLNLGLRRHALIWTLSCLEKRIERLRELKNKGLLDENISEYYELLDEHYNAMMCLRIANE